MTPEETIEKLKARVLQLEKQLERYKPAPRYPKVGPDAWAIVDEILEEMYTSRREILSPSRFAHITAVRFRIYRALFEGGRYSTTQIAALMQREVSGVRHGILKDRQRHPYPKEGARHTVPPTAASRMFLRENDC